MNDEVLFKNAPKDSVLFRVSKDNLYVDPDFSFKSMLESTDLLAYYDSVDAVLESKEFKTCLVSNLFRDFLFRFLQVEVSLIFRLMRYIGINWLMLDFQFPKALLTKSF